MKNLLRNDEFAPLLKKRNKTKKVKFTIKLKVFNKNYNE